MGYGDFKLMAALGAWFGVSAVPFLILFSSFFGLVAYAIFYFFDKDNGKRLITSHLALIFHWRVFYTCFLGVM